ncbi:MAG: tetratricopeptide repeat protein [Bacteroidales bacterium]|nr:tetratricopeptide repeat protein [Bacteroidales bacterium]
MEKNVVEQNPEHVSFISKGEEFFEKYKKWIIIVAAAIVVIVLGFFGFKKFIQEPKQKEANDKSYRAEQLFARAQTRPVEANANSINAEQAFTNEDYQRALDGDEANDIMGLNEIIAQYGNTPAGNRAKYQAAICNLRLGNLDEAMNLFDKYKGKDLLTPILNEMLKGDVEAEQQNNEAALKHYMKAVKMDNNSITAPYALFKAGLVNLILNDKEKALECFKTIKDDYPESPLYNEVDGYISYTENL